MNIISNAFLEILLQLYSLTGSLGWSIIAFTLIIRSLLLPLSLPMVRSQKKIKEIQPEIKKIKEKHKDDKKAFQLAQLELYKKHNVNPLSGCLPQILQLFVLIVLYQVFTQFITQPEIHGFLIQPHFFGLDLRKPDTSLLLPILAGVSQLILSVMILPGGEVTDIVPDDSKNKKIQEANQKEDDSVQMAAMMQKQMLFIMPIMTGFFAMRFPAGLALYWTITTIFSIGQQYVLSGPGGIKIYLGRGISLINRAFSSRVTSKN